MEVMKADAYGHGLRVCAEYAAPYVDWFAAATLEEALAVRAAAPHTPVLIFGGLLDPEIIPGGAARSDHQRVLTPICQPCAGAPAADGAACRRAHQGGHRHEPGSASRPAGALRTGRFGCRADLLARLSARDWHIYALRLCPTHASPRTARSRTHSLRPFRRSAAGWRPWASTPGLRHCASTGRPARAPGIPLPDGAHRYVCPRHEATAPRVRAHAPLSPF